MNKTIEILAALAEDVTRSVDQLSPQEMADIARLKAETVRMNPLMAIVEPNDPDEPSREPEREPDRNPIVA